MVCNPRASEMLEHLPRHLAGVRGDWHVPLAFGFPLPELASNSLKTSGTPEGTRTPNLLIRSQTLYPIELRVHRA